MAKTKLASELVTDDRINFTILKNDKHIPMTDGIYTIRDMGTQVVITTFGGSRLTYRPGDRVSVAPTQDSEPMVRLGYADREQERGVSIT